MSNGVKPPDREGAGKNEIIKAVKKYGLVFLITVSTILFSGCQAGHCPVMHF
jgi:hypothetical protein